MEVDEVQSKPQTIEKDMETRESLTRIHETEEKN
jgi:hypothetical protein